MVARVLMPTMGVVMGMVMARDHSTERLMVDAAIGCVRPTEMRAGVIVREGC